MNNTIILLATLTTILQTATHLRTLQIKEYRLDRTLDFVASPAGIRYFFNSRLLFRLLFLAGFIFSPHPALLAGYFITTLARKPTFPKFTSKMIILSFFATLLSLFLVIITRKTLFLLFVTLLGIPIAILVCFLFLPIDILIKKSLFIRAKQAVAQFRENNPDIRFIAVTGSVGKTSFRHFLTQILAEKAQTPTGNTNTEVGISKWLINFTKKHKNTPKKENKNQIIILEYGAYKRGEIDTLVDICPPDIAIITTVEPQHLNLFGSLDNIFHAKSEIFASLCTKTRITNTKVANFLKKTSWRNIRTIDIEKDAQNIKSDLNGLSFTFRDQRFHAPNLLGEQNLPSLLMALATASRLRTPNLPEKVKNLTPPPSAMQKIQKYEKLTIIDDSYNCSPASTRAAINFLAKIEESQKILVQSSILELGKAAKTTHFDLGHLAGKQNLTVIFTGRENLKNFQKGYEKAGGKNFFTLKNWQNLKKEGIWLFEGRDSRKIIKKI